jgi:hypothetical protein
MLGLLLLFAPQLSADEKQKTGGLRGKPADDAAAEKKTREVLARFDQGDPGWKVRMRSLAELVKAGPGVAPVLADGLKAASASTREFAAQALVLFAEPSTRPALEKALDDGECGVRIHAVQALSMFGRLAPSERYQKILQTDPTYFGVRPMLAAALEREDEPNPAALRQALLDYDFGELDSARVGELAPDFALTNFKGETHRLREFRGKKTVVLRFILFDY